MKNKRDEFFIDACERTMLQWLPIRKSIIQLTFEDKSKFWFQLWVPLLLGFIAVVAFDWIGIIIAILCNVWWFRRWNEYLKRWEDRSNVHERHK